MYIRVKEFFAPLLLTLEGTAWYAGLLIASAKDFGQGFFALWPKKELIMSFVLILGNFLCLVVTLGKPSK